MPNDLKNQNCAHECAQGHCPFVNDPQNPRRYVCLKCGLERSLDKYDNENPPVLALVFTAVIIFMLLL